MESLALSKMREFEALDRRKKFKTQIYTTPPQTKITFPGEKHCIRLLHLRDISSPRISFWHRFPAPQIIEIPARALALQHFLHER